MNTDTALTTCPEYPPQYVEQLPHYEGGAATPNEVQALYSHLREQSEHLLFGRMALYGRHMRLSTNIEAQTVHATAVQPRRYPDCGFRIRLIGQKNSADQSMYVETMNVVLSDYRPTYVRRQIYLNSDGQASCETIYHNMSSRSFKLLDRKRQYEPKHELTTQELRDLDDTYVFINKQNVLQHRKYMENKDNYASLISYIGRRTKLAWYYLTG